VRCPFCGNLEDRVVESRESREGKVIRRRRQCVSCEKRFTSYETIEALQLQVVKRDERREPFDRQKLMRGLETACRKRPIAAARLEAIVEEIETALQESGEREIPSQKIGVLVMQRLRDLDEVAYVRFASVYRRFEDVDAFVRELHQLREDES
jgi:transcriptional repressor NrdR